MKLKANYHTHHKLCNHASGNCEDYVVKAISLGMKEIGLTDHNPVPREFMTQEEYEDNWIQRNMTMEEFETIYLKELKEVQQKYGHQISIKTGLECEYLEGHDEYYQNFKNRLDFLNLGIHYYGVGNKIYNSYADITYQNVHDYANAAIKAMKTGLFKVLVHPDLFMFSYKNKEGKRKMDEAAYEASKRMIEAAISNDVYLEINANGIENSRVFATGRDWLYPDRDFWTLAATYPKLKVVIGADAHRPDALCSENIELVQKFAEELGIKVLDFLEFE